MKILGCDLHAKQQTICHGGCGSMNADRRRVFAQRKITWVANDRSRILLVRARACVG